eukprot:6214729-Pleurochrysis_carterae.AAC.2
MLLFSSSKKAAACCDLACVLMLKGGYAYMLHIGVYGRVAFCRSGPVRISTTADLGTSPTRSSRRPQVEKRRCPAVYAVLLDVRLVDSALPESFDSNIMNRKRECRRCQSHGPCHSYYVYI